MSSLRERDGHVQGSCVENRASSDVTSGSLSGATPARFREALFEWMCRHLTEFRPPYEVQSRWEQGGHRWAGEHAATSRWHRAYGADHPYHRRMKRVTALERVLGSGSGLAPLVGAEAMSLAKRLADRSRHSISATKRALDRHVAATASLSFEFALEAEIEDFDTPELLVRRTKRTGRPKADADD
jgi:hypothetical protein